MIAVLIIAAVIAVLALWVIMIYNSLVRLRSLKEEGWSGVDVQLKRRHDLIGNLVESVKGYMTHEKDLLTEVTSLRSRGESAASVKESGALENALGNALGRLNIALENYPTLKANENVMQLQSELSSLENEIQMARRYYNGTVRNLNIKVETFPSNVIAGMFGFSKAEFFELDSADERKTPQVKF